MIREKTVLILGAGASIPFNFPSGEQLVHLICDNINSGRPIKPGRLGHFIDYRLSKAPEFAKALSGSGQSSVDAFLEHRPEFVNFGKLMIAAALLPYEKTDAIFNGPWEKGKPNWYQHLFGMLNISFDEFDKNELAVITFNYDRSFEHYLHTALCESHGRGSVDVAKKMLGIPIVHVHGQLGHLPWQTDEEPVPFDIKMNYDHIKTAAKNIKIIHDDIDDDPEFIRAQELIWAARRIYFLGFGYNETNLKRLGGPDIFESSSADILGTGVNLSKAQRRIAFKHLRKRKDPASRLPSDYREFLEDKSTCYDLIYNKVDLTA